MPSFPGFGPNPANFVETPKATQAPPLSTHLLDDFADNSIDPVKWPLNFGTVSEANGRARVDAPSPVSDSGYRSARRYSFDSVYVQVPTVSTINGGGGYSYTILGVEADSQAAGTDLIISFEGALSQITFCQRIAFAQQTPVKITYDPVQHAWWRIRRSGANVVFETAPNGRIWTTQNTITAPAWTNGSDLGVVLAAGRDSGTADFSEFDNVNILPISTLTDDFDDNSIDATRWPNSYGTTTESGGRAQVNTVPESAYLSGPFYSLDSVHVRVPTVEAAGGSTSYTYTQLTVHSVSAGSGNDLTFDHAGLIGQLRMGRRAGYGFVSGEFVSITYDPVAHAWWRTRRVATTVVFETAPDYRGSPGDWANQLTINAPVYADNPDFEFFLAAGRNDGTGDVAEFDSFNITPPATGLPVFVSPATTPHPSWRRPNVALISRPPATVDVRAQGGTCALGLAGTGQQTSVEFTRTPNPVTVTPPATRYPSIGRPNAGIYVRFPAIPISFDQGTATVGLAATGAAVKVAIQGGTSALGLTGTGSQTSVEFHRTPNPVVVTPPATRYPSLGKPNAAQISKAPPPIPVAAQSGTCALGLTGTGSQTSVEFTRTPNPVTVTPASTRYPSLGKPNAGIYARIPAIPIAFEQGTTALGLAGTGSQTSVEFTRTPNPVTVVPGRTYPRPLLTPNQRLVVRIPPQPPLVPPEQGPAVVGFAITAAPVTKTVQVGGTCALSLAGTGKAVKLASAAGVISVGISGTCTARKIAPHVGVASAGLFVTGSAKKVARPTGPCTLGLIGRVSSTIVRATGGTTTMLLLPRLDPFAQLKKPLHGGTATDVASRDHAGAITDAATHRSAGAVQDTVVSKIHAGTPS